MRKEKGKVISLEDKTEKTDYLKNYKHRNLMECVHIEKEDDYFDEIDFERDLPKEKVDNSFIVIGDVRDGEEEALVAYKSEIEAYKAYKRVSYNHKRIIKGTAIYGDLFGMKVLLGYE